MKKLVYFLLIFLIIFNITGCKLQFHGMYEMDKLLLIRVIGIDKDSKNVDGIKITVASQIVKESGSSDNTSITTNSEILNSEGRTLFEAIRNMHTYSDLRPYWGHTDYILIGEDTAKSDVLKYLDLFVRETSFRLTTKVIVVSGGTAEKVIRNSQNEEMFITDRLDNLFDQVGAISISVNELLSKFLQLSRNESEAAYLPSIRMRNSSDSQNSTNLKNNISLDSIAIFKSNKLLNYIKDDEAHGFNYITGQVESGSIVVEDEGGYKNSLEIQQSDTKIMPTFNGDNLSITIKIRTASNIGEQMSPVNVYNEKSIAFLENAQNEIILNQVNKAIAYAKQNQVDIFGIGDEVFHKYPIKWNNIKDNWINIFPELNIKVLVESKINRTYELREPVESPEEKE